MPIIDIYSKRKHRRLDEINYCYDYLPDELRTQVLFVLDRLFKGNKDMSDGVVSILREEYGLRQIAHGYSRRTYQNVNSELEVFIELEEDVDKVIDAIELSFRIVENVLGDVFLYKVREPEEYFKEAVSDLNYRFKEHSIGYQYDSGIIFRIDSEFMQSEVVEDVVNLLKDSQYSKVNEEFLIANKHFRSGDYKDAFTACQRSFESAMRIVCDKHGWEYNKSQATASKLITVCLKNDLVPAKFQDQFSSLANLLQSGIPTIRNNHGGHGNSNDEPPIPTPLVSFMMHITASTLLFIIESEKEL